MTKRAVCLLAFLLIGAVGHERAFAGEGRREAKAHAARALRQYNLGNFDEAIAEFSKAYDMDPSPVLLYNIAHAHRAAGNLDRALFFYRRYLAEAEPDAPNREKAKQVIHELEERMAAEKAAKDKQQPAAAGAAVAPAPADTASSPATPSPTSPAPAVALGAATPQPGTARPSIPPPPAPSPAEQPTSTRRILAWVAAGGAVAALGTGVAFQIGASGKLSDFNKWCRLVPGTNQPVSNPDMPGRTDGQCADLHDGWSSGNRWALVGYATGAVFAVGSAVLFMTSRTEASTPGMRAGLHIDCRPGPGTVVCGGVF